MTREPSRLALKTWTQAADEVGTQRARARMSIGYDILELVEPELLVPRLNARVDREIVCRVAIAPSRNPWCDWKAG